MSRPLRDARIGWSSYSHDFSHPGDRRRFAAYAAGRGLSYERARLDAPYDVVLVTHSSDLPGWIRRKRREGDRLNLIFELIDSYFVQTNPLRRLIKGTARFALGTESRLSPDFLRTLIRTCEVADAVICSTLEQQEAIRGYNPNVFLSFDWFGDELGPPKSDYDRADRFRIVWEGQSTTLQNLQVIREPLNDLRAQVELHVVTDPVIYRYFARFGSYSSHDALAGIECPYELHPWTRNNFSDHITAADLAVIPIDRSDPLSFGKPENKLLMLWKLGMPVLTTSTPVYKRTMAAAGLDMTCGSVVEWGQRLEAMTRAPPTELEAIGRRAREYAGLAYSYDEFLARFDRVFTHLGFAT